VFPNSTPSGTPAEHIFELFLFKHFQLISSKTLRPEMHGSHNGDIQNIFCCCAFRNSEEYWGSRPLKNPNLNHEMTNRTPYSRGVHSFLWRVTFLQSLPSTLIKHTSTIYSRSSGLPKTSRQLFWS